MLSRHFFRELTDSILNGVAIKRSPFCLLLAVRSGSTISRSNSPLAIRVAHSSSSTRWKARQGRDRFTKEAKVQGLKGRAAFKLLEMNEKYKLFKPGNTVVDLGYAPGSWSQVAIDRTQPNGRVIGIDILPAQPPRGVSTIQGNFLSPAVQAKVRAYVQDPERGRPRRLAIQHSAKVNNHLGKKELREGELSQMGQDYIDLERRSNLESFLNGPAATHSIDDNSEGRNDDLLTTRELDSSQGRVVDVVLSDMCAPWDLVDGFSKRSISNPYHRMMNTSGMAVRDHAGSMDLCVAALTFAFDTLKTGGHFLCKFYQGTEDKALETKLKTLFEKVHREKPESSRSQSKEAYFVGLRRKAEPTRDEVFQD